jgi:hypothetical protein
VKFFLPDWDDRVDPGFDFQTERFTLSRDPYRDDLYAHELLERQVYDGVLLSRSSFNNTGPKRDLLNGNGARRYLRLPSNLELLGDCGAFSYVSQREPLFTSEEMVDFYETYGFDYGVSVDHLIVPQFDDQRAHRYEVTLRNAETFLNYYRQEPRRFVPIGAVQGWDLLSYAESAASVVRMGYDYIAIGGLARSTTEEVRSVVSAVRMVVPETTRIHVFGVARLTLLPFFIGAGITSVDSAAPLRQAWLSAKDNYYTPTRTYAAIRIPVAEHERARASHTLLARSPLGDGALGQLMAAEKAALKAVRAYDRGHETLRSTLEVVMAYDRMLGSRAYEHQAARREALYRETLRDKPWKKCKCKVCRALGVEVIIFRGNNRNRRRGFHNMHVTYERLAALHGEATEKSVESQLSFSLANGPSACASWV